MKIGKCEIGGEKVFVIAELSANHAGDLEIALRTIEAAKEAGADAVKLQTYTPEWMTLKIDRPEFRAGDLWEKEYLYDLYARAQTPLEWHGTLFEHARSLGLEVFSSPFAREAVDFLETFDPAAYKIASFEITDYELIRYAASKGRPMIISTGVATICEIQDAVDICRGEGNDRVVLLKCTSAYPAPLEEANLRTIPNLAETFGVISGFSDHTPGITAPVAAVALGAKVIEKHLILDKSVGGPDAGFSLDKEEFASMVQAVRETEKLLGKVDYSMTEKREQSRRFARSLYVVKEIKAGETLSEDNIRSIRPGFGLHPKHLSEVLGKKAARNVEAGTPLSWELFE